jgi:hypothetical protein
LASDLKSPLKAVIFEKGNVYNETISQSPRIFSKKPTSGYAEK